MKRDVERYLADEPVEARPPSAGGLTARRKEVTVDAWPRLPDAGRRVVRLYEAWGKSADADRWRKKIPPVEGDHRS